MTARLFAISASALRAESPHDAVIVVATSPLDDVPAGLRATLADAAQVDASFGRSPSLVLADGVPGRRLVFVCTGGLGGDTDDVRIVAEAAAAGVVRARDAGSRNPALVFAGMPTHEAFTYAVEAGCLGALAGLWQPLEAREALGEAEVEPVASIGVCFADTDDGARRLAYVEALEAGRRLARDLAGTDPERMSPPRMAEFCVDAFANTDVQVEVLDDIPQLTADYPLLMAVARASLSVPRHHPRVVRLTWEGDGPITRTILLAGKGLSYDTGGVDLKVGGSMPGMSRDKGGAAAVAGFVRTASILRPSGLRIVAELGCVRNSIGADAFVPDEIVRGHSGCRVRIGNTDAEGRLVLADLLSHLRVLARSAPSPHVLSVATLTGHAARAVGPYSIALDNGPARRVGMADALERLGDLHGDPFAVSRLRREDYRFIRPRTKADDVLSCNNAPSSVTARGHQFPAAFLDVASGLSGHGSDSALPVPFTHIDIAGSGVVGGDWQHGQPTAAPLVAMARLLLEC